MCKGMRNHLVFVIVQEILSWYCVVAMKWCTETILGDVDTDDTIPSDTAKLVSLLCISNLCVPLVYL